ncbi:hypothetical protein ACFFJB_09280 [Camelimonas abortus]|uniref:Uncharacterized protein n=2 Tax=Camelimonas abortus TaxID=1017184 RepID=A0ABV7LCX2_9HYPH
MLLAGPAVAQPVPTYYAPATASYGFPGYGEPRYADPAGAPRNVCFNAAALHRWCRVFVTPNPGSCVCGSAGGVAFTGTLITDAQLYELIGEDVKQAEVGANGRRVAGRPRSAASHYGY